MIAFKFKSLNILLSITSLPPIPLHIYYTYVAFVLVDDIEEIISFLDKVPVFLVIVSAQQPF